MARDRPSPYGGTRISLYRSAGACPPQALRCLKQDFQDFQDEQDNRDSFNLSVARGPVPRERFLVVRRWRGTGPRATVEEDVLLPTGKGAAIPQ